MPEKFGPQFPAAAFLWPALAAEQASEFAFVLAKQFASFAVGPATISRVGESSWTTPHEVLLELDSVRLRDFSTAATSGIPTLVCAPYALHESTITDLAPEHSLVAALNEAGVARLFVTDWRSATAEMRYRSIDDYLADLNVLVDQLDGEINLVGLCQGGWLALIYAALFPRKVRKLALAGAPIDICAGKSRLSELARNTPGSIFKELVELGNGRILGDRLRQLWYQTSFDDDEVHHILQASDAIGSSGFEKLALRFRQWQALTLDLPGAYYLQVVEQLFQQNQLATGRFVALGRVIDLSTLRCPMFLLGARDDEIVASEQLFAVQGLVDSRCGVRKAVASCTHLGLFMGRETLSRYWPVIARWLGRSAQGGSE